MVLQVRGEAVRILLINPNTSEELTATMTAVGRQVAGPDAEIVPLTAPRGFPYIASRAEAQIAGGIVYEMLAERIGDADVVIIAAFGDPGLKGAREIFDVPIVGMAEAAVMSAAMLGERFAIVTFSPVMTRWYTDCVVTTGLESRFAGVRTPSAHRPDVLDAGVQLRDEIVALARSAVHEDGADVVILGGAPLAGLGPNIQAEIPAPVIDPISAATVQAIALARLSRSATLSTRAAKPVPKTSIGLAAPLAAHIAGERLPWPPTST